MKPPGTFSILSRSQKSKSKRKTKKISKINREKHESPGLLPRRYPKNFKEKKDKKPMNPRISNDHYEEETANLLMLKYWDIIIILRLQVALWRKDFILKISQTNNDNFCWKKKGK